jgi:hypothetical protein
MPPKAKPVKTEPKLLTSNAEVNMFFRPGIRILLAKKRHIPKYG